MENAPLTLNTDASKTSMGAFLKQYTDGRWEPLGFFSKKFSEARKTYSTYDREFEAIYTGLKFFKHLTEGRCLTIRTDHKSLSFAFTQKFNKASARHQRRLEYINQFTTSIVRISG